MKDVKALRHEAANTITAIKNGKMDIKEAQTIVRTMNSMISSSKAQIDHYRAIGKKSKINFLVTD